MAKYPVEIGDDEGVNDALNYLLSGPGGLGQFFKGFNSYSPTYLTANFRPPYTTGGITVPCTGNYGEYTLEATSVQGLSVNMIVNGAGITPNSIITDITGNTITLNNSNLADIGTDHGNLVYFTTYARIYIPNIPLGVSEMLDGNTWKFNFLVPEPVPPFSVGNNISVLGVDDPYYDGDYSPIGVVSCTTDYVIARTDGTYDIVPPSNNGNVFYYNTRNGRAAPLSLGTDCNAKVVMTGATDRIFISAQLNNIITVTDTVPCDFNYTVSIDRYVGAITNDPVNPEYRFEFDQAVSRQIYNYYGVTSTTLDNVETIFTNVIDSPKPGYYWYILNVAFNGLQNGVLSSDLQVVTSELGVRSLSAQVVKQ